VVAHDLWLLAKTAGFVSIVYRSNLSGMLYVAVNVVGAAWIQCRQLKFFTHGIPNFTASNRFLRWPLLMNNIAKGMKGNIYNKWIICLLASLLLSFGCGRFTRIEMEGENPPNIYFSVNGTLTAISVNGPDIEREANRENRADPPYWKVYWKLVPQGTNPHHMYIDKSNPITYGKVPIGFVQVYPEHGPPDPLIEGTRYTVRLMVENGDGVNALFMIHKGKVVVEGY